MIHQLTPEMPSSIVKLGGYSIQTTVTDEVSDINRLVKKFLSNNNNKKKIIGLDTERVQKGRRRNKTALLQLCDGEHCLVVQLPDAEDKDDDDDEDPDLPFSLFNFLNLPEFIFVGIDINKNLMKLESEFGLTCKNAVEVGPASGNLTFDWKYLLGDIVTENPPSPVFDDWDKDILNKNQIKRAVWNAYFAFSIGSVTLNGFGF